jgi:arsenate reductase
MIRQSGEETEVIEYLKAPPSREKLKELITAMGITPRELLRKKGTKLCRPSETVLDILPNPDIGPFTEDNGDVVIDASGKRVR